MVENPIAILVNELLFVIEGGLGVVFLWLSTLAALLCLLIGCRTRRRLWGFCGIVSLAAATFVQVIRIVFAIQENGGNIPGT